MNDDDNVELEKKRGVKSTDTGKKLTCPKYLCENVVSNKRTTAKEDPFPVENLGLPNPW
jgi:hypothetical protein